MAGNWGHEIQLGLRTHLIIINESKDPKIACIAYGFLNQLDKSLPIEIIRKLRSGNSCDNTHLNQQYEMRLTL